MSDLTHAELVKRAERWLRGTQKCGVVVTERACGGALEIPDAIGWKWGRHSILVECKTSRADFRRDREKGFRDPRRGVPGMGQRRYYMTPSGLLKPEEIPSGWGLLEVRNDRVKVVLKPSQIGFDMDVCYQEFALLYSFARRTQLGVEPTAGCLVGSGDQNEPDDVVRDLSPPPVVGAERGRVLDGACEGHTPERCDLGEEGPG